jgi:hypothetical protein
MSEIRNSNDPIAAARRLQEAGTTRADGKTYTAGDLGLDEWINNSLAAVEKDKTLASLQKNADAYISAKDSIPELQALLGAYGTQRDIGPLYTSDNSGPRAGGSSYPMVAQAIDPDAKAKTVSAISAAASQGGKSLDDAIGAVAKPLIEKVRSGEITEEAFVEALKALVEGGANSNGAEPTPQPANAAPTKDSIFKAIGIPDK